MKHAAIIAAAALAATIPTTAPARTGNTYPAAAAVVAVTETAPDLYTITARTAGGLEYAFYSDSSDWLPGDLAALIMDDAGTPSDVTDDEITAARYAGYGDPAAW